MDVYWKGFFGMRSNSYRNRTVGWAVGATLVATVAGVTGCSNDTESAAEEKPTASSSTAGESQKSSATRQSTAEEAVATWVTAVVEGKPKQACLVMAEPATASKPARVGSPSMCNSGTPEARKIQENIGKFRTSFTPKPPTSNPKVEVAQVPVTGDKAVIAADKVTIDGQSLDKVILSNSTGVEPGQLDVKVESTKIDDAWYVTNLDFNIG
ncbi:hypothetical protein AB0H86_09730 [Streptomyces sp. NPDC050997]|uniref:hypothetical protein n=1 Tax=Streptomyces sp. NPDC050997 TaxID=3155519 RepID=UPI00342C18EF